VRSGWDPTRSASSTRSTPSSGQSSRPRSNSTTTTTTITVNPASVHQASRCASWRPLTVGTEHANPAAEGSR
jgi:hypothetical protein